MFGVPGFSKDDVPFKDSFEEGGLHVLVPLKDTLPGYTECLNVSVAHQATKQVFLLGSTRFQYINIDVSGLPRKVTHSSVTMMLLVTVLHHHELTI